MIMPMKMLEESLNKKVALLLKDNRVLEGMLTTSFDSFSTFIFPRLLSFIDVTKYHHRSIIICYLPGLNVRKALRGA